jgi:hypothetical protein
MSIKGMNGRASSDAKTCTDRNEKHQILSYEGKIIFNISGGTDKILLNITIEKSL